MAIEKGLSTEPRLVGPRGICRDGESLVVDLTDYELPQFCIATGRAVEPGDLTLFVTCLGLNLGESTESSGFDTIASALFIKSYTAKLRVGLVPELAARLRRSNRSLLWGNRLIWIGVLVGLAGFVASLILWFFDLSWAPAVLALTLAASSVAVVIGGLILWRRERFVRVRRRLGSILWLSGLHPDFLNRVPARETLHEFADTIDHRIRTAVRDYLLGAALFLTVALVLGMWGIDSLREQLSSRTWKAVDGTITSSEVRRTGEESARSGPRQNRFELALTYDYVVQGSAWHGTRQSFGAAPSSHHRAAAERLVRQYPVGERVTVYYDEKDPQRSSLSRAEKPWRAFGWRFAPGVIGLLALGKAIRWWRFKRRWRTHASRHVSVSSVVSCSKLPES